MIKRCADTFMCDGTSSEINIAGAGGWGNWGKLREKGWTGWTLRTDVSMRESKAASAPQQSKKEEACKRETTDGAAVASGW